MSPVPGAPCNSPASRLLCRTQLQHLSPVVWSSSLPAESHTCCARPHPPPGQVSGPVPPGQVAGTAGFWVPPKCQLHPGFLSGVGVLSRSRARSTQFCTNVGGERCPLAPRALDASRSPLRRRTRDVCPFLEEHTRSDERREKKSVNSEQSKTVSRNHRWSVPVRKGAGRSPVSQEWRQTAGKSGQERPRGRDRGRKGSTCGLPNPFSLHRLCWQIRDQIGKDGCQAVTLTLCHLGVGGPVRKAWEKLPLRRLPLLAGPACLFLEHQLRPL